MEQQGTQITTTTVHISINKYGQHATVTSSSFTNNLYPRRSEQHHSQETTRQGAEKS
jgi:hypothetical protein